MRSSSAYQARCVTLVGFALQRDGYGYSDSRGRDASREALARYESARMHDVTYDIDNVSIGLGGTAMMAGIADMVLTGASTSAPAVCGIPNYPPLGRGPAVVRSRWRPWRNAMVWLI